MNEARAISSKKLPQVLAEGQSVASRKALQVLAAHFNTTILDDFMKLSRFYQKHFHTKHFRISGALFLSSAFPAPSALLAAPAQQATNPQAYQLGAQDIFKIEVKDFPEFNQEGIIVPPDGMVSLPFYGRLRVGGQTVAQVQAQLRQRLLRELRAPQLAVRVTQFRPVKTSRIFLIAPGLNNAPIEISEGARLTEILASAGGIGDRLDEKRVVLTRKGQTPITINLRAAIENPGSAANLTVKNEDVITVTPIAPGLIVISGDVANPGTFTLHRVPKVGERELPLTPRLSDAILAAGGLNRTLSANVADSGTAKNLKADTTTDTTTNTDAISPTIARDVKFEGVLQRQGRRIDLDVEAALNDIRSAQNIPLQAGDFLTFNAVLPPAPIRVFVDGLVARTGALEVAGGTQILQILSEAGGLTQPLEKIVASVRRGNQTIPVDLKKVMFDSSSDANFALQAGDVLQIREPDIIRVSVAGSVTKPGELRLRPGTTLRKAIFEAGDPSILPAQTRLTVVRQNDDGTQKLIKINAASLMDATSVEDNIVLQEGDFVTVSPVENKNVIVSGEVNTPGSFAINPGEGLPELLTRAGGAKDSAALTNIVIERSGKNISVDALDAYKKGVPLDFELQDGDFVKVQPIAQRVLVMEAVGKPGYYPIPERGQLTLLDALGEAGGPSGRTKEIVLVRQDLNDPQAQPIQMKFPIQKVRGGPEGRTVLRNGDVVYVPATVAKPNLLQTLGSTLGLFRFFIP